MPTTRTLQEVTFAAHFQAPLGLSLLDLADWTRLFQQDYPMVQQAPPNGRVELAPSQAPQISFNVVTLPRMVLQGLTGTVQLQDDRFGLSWIRSTPIGEDEEYPGYPQLVARFVSMLGRFEGWAAERLEAPSLRLAELSYLNVSPFTGPNGRLEFEDVTRMGRPSPRPMNFFQASWGELLGPDPAGARVTVTAGLGATAGVSDAFIAQFLGLAPLVAGAGDAELRDALDTLHARTIDMHGAISIPGASDRDTDAA